MRSRMKPWLRNLAMRRMDPLRVETIEEAQTVRGVAAR